MARIDLGRYQTVLIRTLRRAVPAAISCFTLRLSRHNRRRQVHGKGVARCVGCPVSRPEKRAGDARLLARQRLNPRADLQPRRQARFIPNIVRQSSRGPPAANVERVFPQQLHDAQIVRVVRVGLGRGRQIDGRAIIVGITPGSRHPETGAS